MLKAQCRRGAGKLGANANVGSGRKGASGRNSWRFQSLVQTLKGHQALQAEESACSVLFVQLYLPQMKKIILLTISCMSLLYVTKSNPAYYFLYVTIQDISSFVEY